MSNILQLKNVVYLRKETSHPLTGENKKDCSGLGWRPSILETNGTEKEERSTVIPITGSQRLHLSLAHERYRLGWWHLATEFQIPNDPQQRTSKNQTLQNILFILLHLLQRTTSELDLVDSCPMNVTGFRQSNFAAPLALLQVQVPPQATN